MNKFQSLYISFISKDEMKERLFFTGFILYLIRCVWFTTTFYMPEVFSKLSLIIGISLILLKILLFDFYDTKFLIYVLAGGAITVLTYQKSGYYNPLLWYVLVIGSKDIPFKKIVKVHLIITGTIVLLAFFSSTIGVIENFQYITESRGTRNSFGIIYTTDFAAYIFFLVLDFYYLKGNSLRFYHYIITLTISALVFKYCDARLDSLSIVLTIAVFACGNAVQNSKYSTFNLKKVWAVFWKKVALWCMPVLSILSILLSELYTPNNQILSAINEALTNRLSLGKTGIDQYGFSIFGQYIPQIGMGGATTQSEDYFFFDISYISILMLYGLFCLLLVLAVYLLICKKNSDNIHLLYVITIMAINCAIAHHLMEFNFNVFTLALVCENTKISGYRTNFLSMKVPI